LAATTTAPAGIGFGTTKAEEVSSCGLPQTLPSSSRRWTAQLFAKQDWHKFFVVVGLDQLTHQATLCVTMWFAFYR
jgi:hypothetical protein